jgi:hypothetical protein
MSSASLLVVTCLASAALFSTPGRAHAPTDQRGLGLEATCRVASGSNQTEFHIVLRNDSGADTAVVVGFGLGNGHAYFPVGVSVRSTTPAGEEKFSFSPVPPVWVGGRLDPWLVPLPTGATYSFSVPTTHFWNLESGIHRSARAHRPGCVGSAARHISGIRQEGMRLWKVWIGELASTSIKLPADCERGM